MLFRQPFGAYAKSCTIFDKNKEPFATVPSKKLKPRATEMEAKRSTICLIYNPCHRLKVTEGCTKKRL